jgi:hypothetical protein
MAALNVSAAQARPQSTAEDAGALSPRMIQQLRDVDQKPLSNHFYSEEEKAGSFTINLRQKPKKKKKKKKIKPPGDSTVPKKPHFEPRPTVFFFP